MSRPPARPDAGTAEDPHGTSARKAPPGRCAMKPRRMSCPLPSAQARASIYHHALAAGITRGFLAASGIALAALAATAVTIRVRREDLTSPAAAAPAQPASADPQ